MVDWEDLYSLLFTGILVLFLFVTVHNIIYNYHEDFLKILSTNRLLSIALNYSNIIYSDEVIINTLVTNLETNETIGSTQFNNTVGLPCLIFNEIMFVGRVVSGE